MVIRYSYLLQVRRVLILPILEHMVVFGYLHHGIMVQMHIKCISELILVVLKYIVTKTMINLQVCQFVLYVS